MRYWLIPVFTALLEISAPPVPCLAAGGDAGLAFLRLGIGPRASAMGGAAAASVNDATAVYWNPARMIATPGADVTLIHTRIAQGIAHQFVGATFHAGASAFGLGFALLTVEGIERRNDLPSRLPLATFNAYDVMASLSFARQLPANLSAGVTVKGVSEKILFHSASGIAFDAGLAYVHPSGLAVGASLRNMGRKLSFIQEKFSLPRELRLGAAYTPDWSVFQKRATMSVDVSRYRGESARLHTGAEYTYRGRFAAMVGYQSGDGGAGFAAGFRIGLQRYRLDYAFAPLREGLGHTHRLAMGITL